MLASTVQFSTNNQPTTTKPPPAHKEHGHSRLSRNGMKGQVMPGELIKQLPTLRPTVVLSGLNRVLIISGQPHQQQPFRRGSHLVY
jgi:hypothetical protein